MVRYLDVPYVGGKGKGWLGGKVLFTAIFYAWLVPFRGWLGTSRYPPTLEIIKDT